MSAQPGIGEWYRIRGGDQFEVVAIDEDDGTIEVQYSDGTVEELDLGDWEAQQTSGNVEEADAPDDWSGSADFDKDREEVGYNSHFDSSPHVSGGLEGLDLFENPDFSFQ
jgi:hypothetical protein